MPGFAEQQALFLELRQTRDDARVALRKAVFALRDLDARIAAASGRAPRGQEDRQQPGLQDERDRQAAEVERKRRSLSEAQSAVRRHADGLFSTDPRRLIEQLDDRTPFLLLPLRIETKFAGTEKARELLVRIFPDDVAVTSHEAMLTAAELKAGQDYWKARALANGQATPAARANATRGAWSVLVARHSAYRASWIARASRPRNWTDAMVDPGALDFEPLPTKPAGWTEAARSFVLPERFVVILISGDRREAFLGNVIADDLALGPDPMQTEGLFKRDEDTRRITVPDELKWLVDFESAVTAGMALRIALSPPWSSASIEKLVVLGMRAAEPATRAAEVIERLLEAHRYSSGISLVPQGTPTNNTDGKPSGFATQSAIPDEAFDEEVQPPKLVPNDDPLEACDGQRLAEALGISLDAVSAIPGATLSDAAEAIAMNRALWPATMGGFLRDMMRPLLTDETIDRLFTFFKRFVLGRGTLPALRVGPQPYGILPTSALRRWVWSEAELAGTADFWNALLVHILRLEKKWREELLPNVSYVGKPGETPFAHLMSVVGLQASSVEFYNRNAITNDYLANYVRLKDSPHPFNTTLWENLQKEKVANLDALGLQTTARYKLQDLIFWREHELLSGPVVDSDPALPLSEDARLRKYDGVNNYIDWLTLSKRAQIDSQEFIGADGKRVSAPSALLYRLLRHAYLAELGQAGVRFAKLRATAFAELPDEPLIANVGASKSLLQRDVLNLDLAKIGITAKSTTAADYLIEHARMLTADIAKPPEAVPLADMTLALRRLSGMATARLERAFAEHLDTCSYRLDAWIHALFARRLALLRESPRQPDPEGPNREGPRRLFIGAYGYVENLASSTSNKVPVPFEQVPAALQPDVSGPVIELKEAGGYVHAPSLPQAVTAAVLRNAFMSHSSAPDAQTMAVNLTSSRVRVAHQLMQGLRNGQDLAALLGYQLERGLHEAHPGVELDEFIYVLREKFPLLSRKVSPVPDGSAAEVIEARNVINGYDLLDYVRQHQARNEPYPYGITGLSVDSKGAPVSAARSAAIAAEIDRLADAMDALGDLLLAESVHQVVQGNYDRAKGSLQAMTEGESPPDVEVVQTPRSGRVLNFRIALQLDPSQVAGWQVSLTPRAALASPLNHWLKTVLPVATKVQWQVTVGAAVPQVIDLTSLGLEPLDIVLMCGNGHGEFSSDLERLIEYSCRRGNAVPDEMRAFYAGNIDNTVPVEKRLVFDFSTATPGQIPLATLWPLLKSLRSLVSQSRALHANDYRLPTDAQSANPANPKGYDNVPAVQAAVDSARLQLQALRDDLDAFISGALQAPWDTFETDHVVVPAWGGLLGQLRDKLLVISRWATPEALPASAHNVDRAAIETLVPQAKMLVPLLDRRLEAAKQLSSFAFSDPLPADPAEGARIQGYRLDTLIGKYAEAAKLLVGKSFGMLPAFSIHTEARPAVDVALAAPVETDAGAIEDWLRPLARVRAPAAALARVANFAEWLQPAPLSVVPIQLPARAGDAWIGTEFGTALGSGEVLSLALLQPPANAAMKQCGLLIDEWSELVPVKTETTGLAFQVNRPNAQPPQTLLLAIAPELRGSWRWDDLVDVILDTFDRAKLRAVEPEHVVPTPYFQLLPTVLQEFSNYAVAATRFTAAADAFVTLAGKL